MKIEWNKKYTTIAVYAVIVIAVAALIILACLYMDVIGKELGQFIRLIKPVIYGFVFAYLFCPLLNLMERRAFSFLNKKKPRRKLQRTFALISTYLIVLILVTLFSYVFFPQIVESFNTLTKRLVNYVPSAQTYLTDLFHSSTFFQDQIAKLEESISGLLTKSLDIAQQIIPYITQYAAAFVTEMKNALIGFIISIYFLASKEKLLAQIRKLINAMFPQSAVKKIYHVSEVSHKTFGGFIVGKIVDSFIIGILTLVICIIFGMPYAPLLSLIIGVTNVIPFFGPIIGAVPTGFIVLIAEPQKVILFIIIVFLIQQLDGNVIGPWILGDSTGLSALWVVVAITVSSSLFGIFGLFLGVPAFGVIYVFLKEGTEKRLAARGLSEDTNTYFVDKDDIVLYQKKRQKKPMFRMPQFKHKNTGSRK